MDDFSRRLRYWYRGHKRELPWRNTTDPYRIWISEVILQQTRVSQGLAYYNRFIERFPTVEALAAADLDTVMTYWQGLGYYSRARNLHEAAKQVVEMGKFPYTYSRILKLKGVGEYTAAAIASIAFNLPYAVVDGNVYRVLSRYFGVDLPIDTTEGKKYFKQLAQQVLDESNPSVHNQAIMEFGALQCVPKGMDCHSCCLASSCAAFANGNMEQLPVKSKHIIPKNRFFTYFYIEYDHQVLIRKRTANDIWKDLYEFPMIETEDEMLLHEMSRHNLQMLKSMYSGSFQRMFFARNGSIMHTLTHQIIKGKMGYTKLMNRPEKLEGCFEGCKFVPIDDLDQYAFPQLIVKLMECLNKDKIENQKRYGDEHPHSEQTIAEILKSFNERKK